MGPDWALCHPKHTAWERLSEDEERDHAKHQLRELVMRKGEKADGLEWWHADALTAIRATGRLPHWRRECKVCGTVQVTSVDPARYGQGHPDGVAVRGVIAPGG